MRKFVWNGLKVQFNLNEDIIKSCDGKTIVITPYKENLYENNFTNIHKVYTMNMVQSSAGDGALTLWHHCLGHLNMIGVYTLQDMVNGINFKTFSCPTSSLFYKTCIKNKQNRVTFPNKGEDEQASLWRLWIPTFVAIDDATYFVTFINDISKKMWCMRWSPKRIA